MMNNTLLCMSLLLLSGIIQTTYGAIARQIIHISPGEPEVCKYGEYTIPVGEAYNDSKLCGQYSCDKTGNPNELQLEIVTCGGMPLAPETGCYLAGRLQGIPYPMCCERTIVCPSGVEP